MSSSTRDLLRIRLRNQLVDATARQPSDAQAVVAHLGAVQAQEYGLAKWSVGQRATGLTDTDLDAALANGTILRTHILRPTWHFVAPQDIRAFMRVAAPRIALRHQYRNQQLGLDERTLGRSKEIIAGALAGQRRLTRRQIGALLADAGIDPGGQRLPYILMRAELDLLICSGGLAGREHTYALLDEVAPAASSDPDADEALATLTRRYFIGHGPATADDLAWWASLTLTQARRGIALAADSLEQTNLEGTDPIDSADRPTDLPPAAGPAVHLLQTFDELIVGYRRTRTIPLNPNTWAHPIVVDGEVAGSWRRVRRGGSMTVETTLARKLSPAERSALDAALARHEAFLRPE